jgi:hypothetical protein
MRSRAVIVALAVLVSACEATKDERANLPYACETKQCVCTEAEKFVLRKVKQVPVEWNLGGDAYCPKGYVLRLAGG